MRRSPLAFLGGTGLVLLTLAAGAELPAGLTNAPRPDRASGRPPGRIVHTRLQSPQSQPASAAPAAPASRPAFISGDGKRFLYTPRPYPVDERGFSPVDKALAKAYAREEMITDDAEGALNPYVMKVISAYPLGKTERD